MRYRLGAPPVLFLKILPRILLLQISHVNPLVNVPQRYITFSILAEPGHNIGKGVGVRFPEGRKYFGLVVIRYCKQEVPKIAKT